MFWVSSLALINSRRQDIDFKNYKRRKH